MRMEIIAFMVAFKPFKQAEGYSFIPEHSSFNK